jgi:hypothetical protein
MKIPNDKVRADSVQTFFGESLEKITINGALFVRYSDGDRKWKPTEIDGEAIVTHLGQQWYYASRAWVGILPIIEVPFRCVSDSEPVKARQYIEVECQLEDVLRLRREKLGQFFAVLVRNYPQCDDELTLMHELLRQLQNKLKVPSR